MIEWHRKVGQAQGIPALLEVMGDYLRSISHEEWATVPENCRPVSVQGVHALRFWHDRLVDEFCARAATMSHSRAHQDLVGIFIAALERAEQLAPTPAANDPSVAQQRNPTKP